MADAYERGAAGEEQTAQALTTLSTAGWFVLHDVRWPGKRFANIDHVVVGPGGVFVIDSKAWSGRVEVRDGVLRQNRYKRESAVSDAAEAALAVAAQVAGLDPYLVKPVLCFVGEHHLEGWARDVMLCTPQNLVAMLVSRPAVMDESAISRTLLHLQHSLVSASSAGFPAASSRRRPTADPASRRRTNPSSRTGGGRALRKLLGGLTLMLAGLVGLGFFLEHAPDIARGITSEVPRATSDQANGHHAARGLGVTQAVPAATGRPSLHVTASQARSVHRIGASPHLFDGNRFYGVRFTIINRGRHVWLSQPGTTCEVTGESGIPRRGGSAIRIREGSVLPEPIRLAPGHRLTGYVVFQVPVDEPITTVSLTVGPGKPSTVSWRIDRQ